MMVKGTRNKVKEQIERVHVNFTWVCFHLSKALDLIGDKNPKLTEGLKSLLLGVETLDSLTQDIYSKL